MEIVRSKLLSQFSEIIQGFSTRECGNMSFRNPGVGCNVHANNNAFISPLWQSREDIRFYDPLLTHSNTVALLKRKPTHYREEIHYGLSGPRQIAKGLQVLPESPCPPNASGGIDACWATEPGTLLTMRPADCAILNLYDPRTRSIGQVHAGTLGILNGIVLFAISMAECWLGINPADLFCFVGPSISAEYYSLTRSGLWHSGLDKLMRYEDALEYDPKKRILAQLLKSGLDCRRIEIHPDCTGALPDKYFSNHCQGSKERMLAVIGLR